MPKFKIKGCDNEEVTELSLERRDNGSVALRASRGGVAGIVLFEFTEDGRVKQFGRGALTHLGFQHDGYGYLLIQRV